MARKTDTLRIRIAPQEKAIAALLAERECQSTSEYLRATIRRDARELGLWPPPEMVARQGQPMP